MIGKQKAKERFYFMGFKPYYYDMLDGKLCFYSHPRRPKPYFKGFRVGIKFRSDKPEYPKVPWSAKKLSYKLHRRSIPRPSFT